MRIVGGKYGGLHLVVIGKSDSIRPTLDGVREAIFNILGPGDLEGLSILDLCAGTGALGIEALSRGASRCTFVERSERAVGLIRTNIAKLGIPRELCTILKTDAAKFAATTKERFDLIFFDPPYEDERLIEQVVRAIDVRIPLNDDGRFIHEYFATGAKAPHPSIKNMDMVKNKVYGQTAIAIYRNKEHER